MVKNKIIKKSIITIGNFDGVHKGHQDIFNLGKKIAKRKKKNFGVITFSPLPYEFFNKDEKIIRITQDESKINLFTISNLPLSIANRILVDEILIFFSFNNLKSKTSKL